MNGDVAHRVAEVEHGWIRHALGKLAGLLDHAICQVEASGSMPARGEHQREEALAGTEVDHVGRGRWQEWTEDLHRQPTVEPALPFARDAGFVDVQVRRLTAIEEFERDLEEETGKPAEKTWLALTAARP